MTTGKVTLRAVHEWIAHDPWGRPHPLDAAARRELTDHDSKVRLRAARNGYVSLRIFVEGCGEFTLATKLRGGFEADLFRAWYHRMRNAEGTEAAFWPDALVPLRKDEVQRIPNPDNRIEGQTVQEFWLDIYVPRDARPGWVEGSVIARSGSDEAIIPIEVEVLPRTVPDRPTVILDYNSYGCRWLPSFYPEVFTRAQRGQEFWRKCIRLLHDYYRLVHEHRGLFHNLGYGHSGAHDPIYGPRTEGRGREKRLVDWELFDELYGPLFDGSAFTKAVPAGPRPRQAPTPLYSTYTPITPDWPASYLFWGEKGYEVEFTRCLAQYDSHLREKGWTGARMEFFFNHKKRYRWFEWDGDEVKYLRDMEYHRQMVSMWESVVAGSPVQWVYRMDASWQMKNQFRLMVSPRNFWVCGGFFRWYPEQIREVVNRGETVFWYTGTAPVGAMSSSVLSILYETFAAGLHGCCQWLTTNPGKDPWFECDGAATGIIYPGTPFGIAGPIPSIRMKILRNGVQDLDLLRSATGSTEQLLALQERLAGQIPICVWRKPPRAALELPPEEWDSYNLGEEHEPIPQEKKALPPMWWQQIRRHSLGEDLADGKL
ncbi:MAG: hypothetical protein ACUVWX_01770 [Kiritimatiellia bacterium]